MRTAEWTEILAQPVGIVLATFLGALVLGSLCAVVSSVRARAQLRRARDEISLARQQRRDETRRNSRMRSEQRSLANFLRLLPETVKRLNSDEVDDRTIYQLIVQMTATMFEPEQIALYIAGTAGREDGGSRQLRLAGHQGLGSPPDALETVPFGEGKIGWVAANGIDMTANDWKNHVRTSGTPPHDNHPALRLDLTCPLVHQAERGSTVTLGVLCIGGPSVRPQDEKLMLQMIANLGAIALTHARNVSNLRSRANCDGLTGLWNKRQFTEKIGLLINQAEAARQPIGVFMFDIDHFKNYNDTNGHLAGDELLKAIARVIRGNLRPDDLPCRYGGEEFVVVMPDTDGDSALRVAERIRRAIEETAFPHREFQPGRRLTISGGVAAFPADGSNSNDLIAKADRALYRAKRDGRNRVYRYRGVQIGATFDDGERDEDRDTVRAVNAIAEDGTTGATWER